MPAWAVVRGGGEAPPWDAEGRSAGPGAAVPLGPLPRRTTACIAPAGSALSCDAAGHRELEDALLKMLFFFFFHYSADKQGWKHHVSTPSGPAALSSGANEEREHVQVTEGGRGIFLAEVVAPVN